MGEAIKACCVAEGGWMDWGVDGKVRFLNRGPGGEIGVFFSAWLIEAMRANKAKIKKYIEMLRAENEARASCLDAANFFRARFNNPPGIGSSN
jgi:hypothetical protein